MPRRPRVFVEGFVYHVYNRVGRGEAPFKLDDEAQALWSLLHEVKRRDGLEVLAWCIMPNHYHLAVRTGTVPLWRSMRFVQHRYSREFNRRCRVLGPVWQARYKARPVETTNDVLRVLAYIHLNPVTAGMVRDPARHVWSGHRELVRHTPNPLIDTDRVFSFLGSTRRSALQAYHSLLATTGEEAWVSESLERTPWWHEEPPVPGPRRAAGTLGDRPAPLRRAITAEELLDRLVPHLGVERADLGGPGRAPVILECRELLAGLAAERWGVRINALAEALGKSRDGVSHWVRRAARRRAEDAAFAARLDELDRRLSESLQS
jgi:REP element-mobilizing transposase RayT